MTPVLQRPVRLWQGTAPTRAAQTERRPDGGGCCDFDAGQVRPGAPCARARPADGRTALSALRRCGGEPGPAASASPSRSSRRRFCALSPSGTDVIAGMRRAALASHAFAAAARNSRADKSVRVIATALKTSILRWNRTTAANRRDPRPSQGPGRWYDTHHGWPPVARSTGAAPRPLRQRRRAGRLRSPVAQCPGASGHSAASGCCRR